MLSPRLSIIARNVLVNSVRRSHGPVYKGMNLPFDITNHRALAVKFALFFGSAFALPWLIVRFHLKKASGQYNLK